MRKGKWHDDQKRYQRRRFGEDDRTWQTAPVGNINGGQEEDAA